LKGEKLLRSDAVKSGIESAWSARRLLPASEIRMLQKRCPEKVLSAGKGRDFSTASICRQWRPASYHTISDYLTEASLLLALIQPRMFPTNCSRKQKDQPIATGTPDI